MSCVEKSTWYIAVYVGSKIEQHTRVHDTLSCSVPVSTQKYALSQFLSFSTRLQHNFFPMNDHDAFLLHHWNSNQKPRLVKKAITAACPILVMDTQTKIPSITDDDPSVLTLPSRRFVLLTHASHSKPLTTSTPDTILSITIWIQPIVQY